MLCQQKLVPKIINKEMKNTTLKANEIIPEKVVLRTFWQLVYISYFS